MNFIGVDLHKQVISACVMVQAGGGRKVIARRTLACADPEAIHAWFAEHRPFQVVVEATAAYEWFFRLIEPLADRVVLAHPKKLRVIAESTRKSDRLDAQALAEFLTLDMIPQAFRPLPRQREHRTLVRHRHYTQRRITAVKNKLRHLLAQHNADFSSVFSAEGRAKARALPCFSDGERFVFDALWLELEQREAQRFDADRRLARFAREAPLLEREARELLASFPCVGPVTIDVLISELGDVRRFRSLKRVAAYAGLAPGRRESAGKSHDLGLTKEGSRLLRWALVETAWRVVGKSRRWGMIYERLKARTNARKAIVAVARRILGVMVSMLRSGTAYRLSQEAFA